MLPWDRVVVMCQRRMQLTVEADTLCKFLNTRCKVKGGQTPTNHNTVMCIMGNELQLTKPAVLPASCCTAKYSSITSPS